MALYKVADLVGKEDKNAILVRQHFGAKYDDYYMQKALSGDDSEEDEEPVVVDEDTAGLRRTVNILCLSVGFLGVRPLPSECDVIIVDGEVFVAGEDEFERKFTVV